MIFCITLKNSYFKEIKVKNIDIENIYKKCGYKSNNNFKKLYQWNYCPNGTDSSCVIELWSKEDNKVKTYNNHPLFIKYNIKININNKCIFLLKNNTNYINLNSEIFSAFFNLQETIAFNTNEDNNGSVYEDVIEETCNDEFKNIANVPLKEILKTDKNISDDFAYASDNHSELSYELYCYSDDNCI